MTTRFHMCHPSLLVLSLLVTVVACGAGSSESNHAGANRTADPSEQPCIRAAAVLHTGADRVLRSSSDTTAEGVASVEQRQGDPLTAAKFSKLPKSERLTVCTFTYAAPRDIPVSGTPTLCPGGYAVVPAPTTDMGYVIAAVDAQGHVTQLPVPPQPAGGDAAC
jgi:hypothetical protein